MAHGGKRSGSGRKKSSATKKTRAVADEAAADGGITPLKVMIEVMRRLYDSGNLTEAVEVARHAAPYCHPRLSAVQHSGTDGRPIPISIVEYVPAPSANGTHH